MLRKFCAITAYSPSYILFIYIKALETVLMQPCNLIFRNSSSRINDGYCIAQTLAFFLCVCVCYVCMCVCMYVCVCVCVCVKKNNNK